MSETLQQPTLKKFATADMVGKDVLPLYQQAAEDTRSATHVTVEVLPLDTIEEAETAAQRFQGVALAKKDRLKEDGWRGAEEEFDQVAEVVQDVEAEARDMFERRGDAAAVIVTPSEAESIPSLHKFWTRLDELKTAQ